MIPDETPTIRIPVKRSGSWLHFVAAEYPTAGDVRRALKRDLIKIPLVGKRSVEALFATLGKDS